MQTEVSNVSDISILYVEDEDAIREGYSRALKRISNKVFLARNGHEGFEMFKTHKPDIVVSDIRMPVMDGIEMLKKIKEIDPDCSVIFTTAFNDNDYLLEALELQVNAYLQKPVQKNLLKEKIEKIADSILKEKLTQIQQKEIERQKVILQNVLDHESNLLVVSDFENVLFANKAFLEVFNVKDVEEFNKLSIPFLNIFMPIPPYLHRGMLKEGENFYDMVQRCDEVERVVTIIGSDGHPKAYQINVSEIVHEDKSSYLFSMTDITKMNIEKISTEKKAYYDNLTKIYNRNKFNELFESELNRVKRYGNNCSLAILDIDHFKSFNDTYGHLVGDKVLVKLAETISQNVRNTDLFARWGGEEFVLLLPETSLENAAILCEKLRKKVEKIECKESQRQVTASFGVTLIHRDDTMQTALARADKALYEAKGAGRNRVMISH